MHPSNMDFLAHDRMRERLQDAEHSRLVRAARHRSNADAEGRSHWMHRVIRTLVRIAGSLRPRARLTPHTAKPEPRG